MTNNYDNAAPFYDRLSRLVFGNTLVKAQVYLLQFVPPNANILLVGGGTGWILEELTRLHPTGLNIDYVEVSAKMMALSQQRNTGGNKVSFINSAIEDVALNPVYDVVFTPFLFDNFTQTTADKLFTHLHTALNPGGLWLNADFELNGKWWQTPLLKTMHLFFKMLCGVEAWRLPGIKMLFQQSGYQLMQSELFFGGFIRSSAYQKPS